ncbi:MAG TPA: cytochrome c oxidase assembly protein [Acetobacteraceae bacterium]|nr:cytochrome c oxidase assembly protein [Acetobacteraceae bacterium]
MPEPSVQLSVPLNPTLAAAADRPGIGPDDVIGLTLLIVLGAILSWLCEEHPALLPVWAPWDYSWSEFLAAALGLWWYGRGVARCPVHARPAVWRQASFVLGVVAIYAVVQTRFDYMAQHEFFLNRIQHIFMHHLGPYLIALAWPGEALLRGMPAPLRRLTGSRILRGILSVVQQPLPACLLFVGLIYVFLIPAVQFQAMIDPRLYAIMNWSMIGDGLLFWILVLDPRPKAQAGISYGMRMALPFGVMFPQIALGARIAFGQGNLYQYYDLCGRFFASIPPATDQHIGGIVVWIPAGMMSAVGFLTVLNALRIHEDSLPAIDEPDDEAASPTRIVLYASSWTGRR